MLADGEGGRRGRGTVEGKERKVREEWWRGEEVRGTVEGGKEKEGTVEGEEVREEVRGTIEGERRGGSDGATVNYQQSTNVQE